MRYQSLGPRTLHHRRLTHVDASLSEGTVRPPVGAHLSVAAERQVVALAGLAGRGLGAAPGGRAAVRRPRRARQATQRCCRAGRRPRRRPRRCMRLRFPSSVTVLEHLLKGAADRAVGQLLPPIPQRLTKGLQIRGSIRVGQSRPCPSTESSTASATDARRSTWWCWRTTARLSTWLSALIGYPAGGREAQGALDGIVTRCS